MVKESLEFLYRLIRGDVSSNSPASPSSKFLPTAPRLYKITRAKKEAMKKAVASKSNPSRNRPTSERKVAANRANARRSTGPRSQLGKARSSLNAIRHGILARAAFNVTLEGESKRAEFDDLVRGLAQEFQPQTLSDHMMVQQVAGCYWRLAKVLTFETETAWRNCFAGSMPLEEMKPFDDQEAQSLFIKLVNLQNRVFPQAGLGQPTIPSGASARTIMRYEGSLNSTLFRCLRILEARRLAREDRGNVDEHDYSNDVIEEEKLRPPEPIEAKKVAPASKKKAVATPPTASAPATAENPPAANTPEEDGLHKRTQNNLVDEALSAFEDLTPEAIDKLTREVERKIRNQIS